MRWRMMLKLQRRQKCGSVIKWGFETARDWVSHGGSNKVLKKPKRSSVLHRWVANFT